MKFTQEQQQWFDLYEKETGFDVMFPEEGMTFEAIAKFNVDWYEDHSGDIHKRLSMFPKSDQYWEELLK